MADLSLALGNVPKPVENLNEVPTKINWSKCDIQTFQQLGQRTDYAGGLISFV